MDTVKHGIVVGRMLVFGLVLLLVTTVPVGLSPARQVGILDSQTSGLWDAVGREFDVSSTSGDGVDLIRVEIGEFDDGLQAYLGVAPTRQKIEYDHTFTHVPVEPGDQSVLLPTFFPDPGLPLAIPYSLLLFRADSGELSAHLLIESSNRLVIVTVLGTDDSVLETLDPIGGTVIARIRSLLAPDTQTVSNALTGTGLWSVLDLDLPAILGFPAATTRDYTPYLFAGIGYRNDNTTLAVRNGVSVPPLEPETSIATVPTPPQSDPTTTPIVPSGPPFNASATVPLPANGWTRTGPFGCEGTHTYTYLRPGSIVSILDETGRILVTTADAEIYGLLDLRENCTIRISIQNVPPGTGGYTMYVGDVRVAVALRTQGLTQVDFFSVLRW